MGTKRHGDVTVQRAFRKQREVVGGSMCASGIGESGIEVKKVN